MEDCRTPNLAAARKFIFNITPTSNYNATTSESREVHHIMASLRSYTPIHTNMPSPGMSPIYKLEGTTTSPVTSHHSSSFAEFKKPSLCAWPVVTYTQSHEDSEKRKFLSPRADFENSNSTMSPLAGGSLVQIVQKNCDNNFIGVPTINRTTTLYQILETVGLQRYIIYFERAGIDCSSLAKLKASDLKQIGIHSDSDCERILNIFKCF